MKECQTLLLSLKDSVLLVTLNRPEARNTINMQMRDELLDLMDSLQTRRDVRAVVITGSGKDFCTGGDLTPPAAAGGDAAEGSSSPPARRSTLDRRRPVAKFQELFRAYWELEVPVVSAVNGTTAGMGWMLALLADLVVAARGARWVHAFADRGMVPHAGDPYFLSRVLPFRRLAEASMLRERFTSEDLDGWGVINRLVEPGDVMTTAQELAVRLAEGPTRSLGLAKALYRRALSSDMATAFREEAAAVAMISDTADRVEGVQSLNEKRAPKFMGE